MTAIKEKAQELGRMLGQSDEYKSLRRATERVKETPELREKMDKLQQLAQTMEDAAQRGEEPSEEQIGIYNTLLSGIQGDADYQSVVAAQSNFDKLMLKVNQEILEGMKKGADSRIITLG